MTLTRKKRIDILFLGLAICCGLAAIYLDMQLTYVASANTETVHIQSLKMGVSQWYIEAAKTRGSCEGEFQKFSGVLRVQSPVKIVIERISSGPMRIIIKSATKSEDQVVAKLHDMETDTDTFATGCLSILIENLSERAHAGKTTVLAVNGYMELGREVRHETLGSIPVLKSGKVQLIGTTLLGNVIYDAGTIMLNTGDLFSVKNPVAGKGLIVADQKPGLTAVSYTLGEQAYVQRFGTRGYKVSSSLWVRFEKDPVIKALTAAFFFILSALAAWQRWWGESDGKKTKRD